jgi:hypothetical protein
MSYPPKVCISRRRASLEVRSFETSRSGIRIGWIFNQGLEPGGKLQEYIDLYADAGWEYVSAFGGTWHYYRREWHEGEEPRLYTDRESLITHYKRIQGDR